MGASEGFLGWIAYLGAANAGIPLSIIVKNYGWEARPAPGPWPPATSGQPCSPGPRGRADGKTAAWSLADTAPLVPCIAMRLERA